jgi:hypothetical protein
MDPLAPVFVPSRDVSSFDRYLPADPRVPWARIVNPEFVGVAADEPELVDTRSEAEQARDLRRWEIMVQFESGDEDDQSSESSDEPAELIHKCPPPNKCHHCPFQYHPGVTCSLVRSRYYASLE